MTDQKLLLIKSKLQDQYSGKEDLNFLGIEISPNASAGSSLLGQIQSYIKKFPEAYYFLLTALGPVMVTARYKRLKNDFFAKLTNNQVLLNVGCGPQAVNHEQVINTDIVPYPNIEMFCDASQLPLKTESVDKIFNSAMLEHVPNPQAIVSEFHRCLKKDGEVLCFVPFMQPFHASPYDFQRYTPAGLKTLFKDFRDIEVGIGSGPTSGLLWVLQDWLATVLSCGSSKLKDLLFLMIMVVTSPLKLLDIIVVHHPESYKISSGFYIRARK